MHLQIVLAEAVHGKINGLAVEDINATDATWPRLWLTNFVLLETPHTLFYWFPIATAWKRTLDRRPLEGKTTARGFEPLRAEPNGFRVHLLNRSDTLSHEHLPHRTPCGAYVQREPQRCK